MSINELEQIEASIAQSKEIIGIGHALERLRANRDFRKLILEGYFQQEAIRLVHLKADDNMQDSERQKSILTQIDAIGSFAQYLQLLSTQARMAAKNLEADEQARDELIEESK